LKGENVGVLQIVICKTKNDKAGRLSALQGIGTACSCPNIPFYSSFEWKFERYHYFQLSIFNVQLFP